jgi:DNA-binding response OmpR family regulator
MRTITVLIVDRDLGFVFWLGQLLTKSGYQTLPAKSCESASELADRLNLPIDILIVGNSLTSASVLAEALCRSNRHLKVIAVLDDGEAAASAFSGADATQYRPSRLDEGSKTEWLKTIEGVLTRAAEGPRVVPSSGAKPS